MNAAQSRPLLIFLNTRKTQSDDICFDSRLSRIKIKTWLSTLARVPWKMARPKFLARCWRKFLLGNCTKCLRGEGGFRGMVDETSTARISYGTRSKSSKIRPPPSWRGLILLDRVGDPRLNSRQIADVKEGRGLNRSPPSQRIKRGNSVSSCATFADSWLVIRWQVKLVDTELTPDRCCLERVSDRTFFTFRAFERFYDTLDNCGRSRLEDRVWK